MQPTWNESLCKDAFKAGRPRLPSQTSNVHSTAHEQTTSMFAGRRTQLVYVSQRKPPLGHPRPVPPSSQQHVYALARQLAPQPLPGSTSPPPPLRVTCQLAGCAQTPSPAACQTPPAAAATRAPRGHPYQRPATLPRPPRGPRPRRARGRGPGCSPLQRAAGRSGGRARGGGGGTCHRACELPGCLLQTTRASCAPP